MTKLEQVNALANVAKSIGVASQALEFACNTLLEVTRELAKPELHVVEKEKE